MKQQSAMLRLPAKPEALAAATEFMEEKAQEFGMGMGQLPVLGLLLEEVVMNVFSHAYEGGEGDMEVEVYGATSEAGAQRVCLLVRDWGVRFNPLEAAPPDTTLSVEDRPIGGVGLLLVSEMSSQTGYAHVDNANELTICLDIQAA